MALRHAMMWQLVTRSEIPISQPFGINPGIYVALGLPGHNGLDLATAIGTPIFAPEDGELTEVDYDAGGYGNYLKLSGAHGCWLFAHLSTRYSAAAGDRVVEGTPLGETGNTGYSTGPHLHIGLRPRNDYRITPYLGWVDPQPYLASMSGNGN